MGLFGDIFDGVCSVIGGAVEFVGESVMKGVKYLSGDSEREKWVRKLEEFFDTVYRPGIISKVEEVNEEVKPLNQRINAINNIRKVEMKPKIDQLHNSLGQFGNLKPVGAYTGESYFTSLNIPQQRFSEVSEYIEDNDLDTSEIIERIVCNLFSIRSKNRTASLEIQSKINDLKLEFERLLAMLEIKKQTYISNRAIADMYIETIRMILDFIDRVILPEFAIVESFMQANRIKDEILSGNKLSEKEIVFNNKIKVLAGSPYHKHYLFVKNSFMFYVIACRIYSSPILTRLLQGETNYNEYDYKQDKTKLQKQIFELHRQKENVVGYLTWERVHTNE